MAIARCDGRMQRSLRCVGRRSQEDTPVRYKFCIYIPSEAVCSRMQCISSCSAALSIRMGDSMGMMDGCLPCVAPPARLQFSSVVTRGRRKFPYEPLVFGLPSSFMRAQSSLTTDQGVSGVF